MPMKSMGKIAGLLRGAVVLVAVFAAAEVVAGSVALDECGRMFESGGEAGSVPTQFS